jgi:hypothetical protein
MNLPCLCMARRQQTDIILEYDVVDADARKKEKCRDRFSAEWKKRVAVCEVKKLKFFSLEIEFFLQSFFPNLTS